MSKNYRYPIDGFNARHIPEPMSGCWLWEGYINSRGYGEMNVAGRTVMATHFSLQVSGAIRHAGQTDACHKCDVKICVNPDHLFWGTRSDNIRDCVAKGRHGHASRTHCPQGHLYAGDNLIVQIIKNRSSGPHRICRICANKSARDRYHARRRLRLFIEPAAPVAVQGVLG